MAALALAGLAGLAFLLLRLLRAHLRLRAAVDRIPGPRAFPLFGNVHQFKASADDFFEQACGTCAMYSAPRMQRIWMAWLPYIMVYGAREAAAILSSNKHINKTREYSFIEPWLGRGLLTAGAQKWRPRRKLLTPTFHHDILKDYVEVYVEQSKILLGRFGAAAGKGAVDVYPLVTLCALDIICETAMGKDLGAQGVADSPYVDAVYRINNMIQERQKKPWLWPSALFRLLGRGKEQTAALAILHGFTNGVITDRLRAREENCKAPASTKRRRAFLDLLLDMVAAGQMPLGDVREEVDTFMFEGHDTTAAGLNWALHLLAAYPEVQAKAQAELDGVFGEGDADLDYADLGRLPYLECVLKETLRLFPSVPIFARMIDEDTHVAGYTVPKGVQVLILPYAVHRDPEMWADPDDFCPERFLPENSKGRHPYAFLPFSAGARNCIGQRFALMEEKTVVAMILRYFSISSPHRRDQIRPKAELILRPTQGVHLHLTPRRPLPTHFGL